MSAVPLLLFVAFLVVPVVEIAIIIQVGQAIGAWQTAVLLLVMSALGAWLVRREGRRAWRALTETFEAAKVPTRELADGALVLVGGTLLLTPGFLTDILGGLLVLPPTRAVARRLLLAAATRRVLRLGGYPGPVPRGRNGGGSDPRGGWAGPVVPGEVVEPDEPR